MANLTVRGENYFLKVITGTFGITPSVGYDKVGIYGSVNGGSDQIIDSLKDPIWVFTSGDGSATITADLVFNIAANTIIKGVALFSTDEGVTYADALSKYPFESPYSYSGIGTFTVDTLVYNLVVGN